MPIKLDHSTTNSTKIPVLNEKSVLALLEDNLDLENSETITIDNLEGECFAFKILNDSMFPPFMENTLMIFDKNKKPTNGCFVIAYIKDDNSVVIRKYNKDGKDIYLIPSSDKYKSFTNPNAELLGVLVESRYLFQ